MFDKMKQLMEFKKQANQIKKELEVAVVDVEDVQGIRISVTGSQKFQTVEIDDRHVDLNNKKQLEKDLLTSMNAAIQKSQKLAAQKMAASMSL